MVVRFFKRKIVGKGTLKDEYMLWNEYTVPNHREASTNCIEIRAKLCRILCRCLNAVTITYFASWHDTEMRSDNLGITGFTRST